MPFPSPGYLPDAGVKPASPAVADRFFTIEVCGKPPHPFFLRGGVVMSFCGGLPSGHTVPKQQSGEKLLGRPVDFLRLGE